MRWPSLLVGCLAACCLILAGRTWAQNPLGAPTIASVTAGTNSLTMSWNAPSSDGGSAIVAYDFRYIRSDHTDKTDDASWTVEPDVWQTGDGTLQYELKELPDGAAYDLQVRADNGGDGPWSATHEATTSDHSDSRSGATVLTLGSSVRGSIDPADDEDFFRVVLAAAGDLWVYTTGSDDTIGQLQSSGGTVLAADDEGQLLDGPRNFSIRTELPAGTYYIRVGSSGALETASYTLHARLATDPGGTKDTATTVALDSITPGRIGPTGGVDGDKDYFKLELSAAADVWVMAVGDVDTYGELLDIDEMVLEENDDSEYAFNEVGFMVRRELDVGTYYIRVTGFRGDDTGPYTLFVRTVADPGSSTTTATAITLGTPELGRIRPDSDQDYFSLTLDEDMYVYMYGLSFGGALPLTPTLTDSSNTVLDDLHVIAHEHWNHNGLPEASFSVWGHYTAGTYYVRVAALSGGTGGPYLIHAYESEYGETEDFCTGITTPQTDPWYGCAWHLDNTGEFPAGAGHDINVEEVWATTMGAGINVAVVDDGLQYAHRDLADNVITARNHDYYGSDIYDPLETHGTQVAGIIAARDNNIGVRGVAPRASIYGFNLIDITDTADLDEADSMTRNMSDTAVSNNSWGPIPEVGFAPAVWGEAIVNGVTNGFGGKGVFYVFAAGNGYDDGEDGNVDEYANHYGVTAVCAIDHKDVRASYSETGPHLWICAPSWGTGPGAPGIATTRNGNRYTRSFSGTSAAAPIVSGVAALVRAVNTDLTWRDVKLILAASARRNDRNDRGAATVYSGWESGALKYGSTTDRYYYNHQYGFGAVDAGAAVALAQGWTTLPELRSAEAESGDLDIALPDGAATPTTLRLTVDSYVGFTEFVEVNVTVDHPSFRDLAFDLVSPSGARSRLVRGVQFTFHSGGTIQKSVTAVTGTIRFGSARHLGENAAGTWTLRVRDPFANDAGTLQSWSIKVYGHGFTPGPPTVATTPVDGALAVEWTTPHDTGGSDVTAYDLRYMGGSLSSWRVVQNVWRTGDGDLRHVIRNLTNDNEYEVQVRAVNSSGDGRWSESADGKPALGNTDPEFPGHESGERGVDENTPAGRNFGDPVAARDDDLDALTYTLAGDAATAFDIVAGTGQLRTREALNHEGQATYTGTVSVTDNKNAAGEADPAIDDVISITIQVEDVPEAPEITGESSHTLPEASSRFVGAYSATDPEGDTVGLSLTGTDAGDFEFSSGTLEFAADPDYETASSHRVTIEATDGSLKSTLAVTVNIENVEEPGTVAVLAQPQEGTPFRATLADPDGGVSGLTWEWERSPDGFTNWSTIDSATSRSYTPTSTDVGQYLRVAASYSDRQGPAKSAAATSSEAVRAAPIGNRPPEFPATATGQRTVSENTPADRTIGARVEATDPDAGDTLTYTLDPTGATLFDIDAGTGQLFTKAALDRERRASYRVTVTATDPSLASASITVTITVDDVDEAPTVTGESVVGFREGGTGSVARYIAADPERQAITWTHGGLDSHLFSMTDGTLAFLAPPDFDTPADVGGDNEYEVTVTAADPAGNSDFIDVTVRVTEAEDTTGPVIVGPLVGFGGGGGPSGPTPSDVDFEWNVTRDIEDLDPGNDWSTGIWSNGGTLWVAENGPGADDEIYAYDLASGERVEDLEFELAETNRAPRGLWSDGTTAWVSDSGQERVFAYDLETGERAEERETVLSSRNRDSRGIWSDGETMWVLDGGKNAVFAYDLASGELIAECALADTNGDPHGIWSDGVTMWVSDHGAKRLIAYRVPDLGTIVDGEDKALERVGDEDFRLLSRASNNSPRGVWSDGDVMYVADENDDRVYTYNLPDAIDARLASLTLTGVDIGTFAPDQTDYTGVAEAGVTETTVEASAAQARAAVEIGPVDTDESAEGHQAAVADGSEITITVTSADETRMRVYRVRFGDVASGITSDEPSADPGGAVAPAEPSDECMFGLTAGRFSLVTYGGGTVADLDACARHLGVTAVYVSRDDRFVSYIVGAPEFVNREFATHFAQGIEAVTPMVAQRAPRPGDTTH